MDNELENNESEDNQELASNSTGNDRESVPDKPKSEPDNSSNDAAKKARQEAQKLRQRLREVEQKLEEATGKEKTELERLQAQLSKKEDVEQKYTNLLRERNVNTELKQVCLNLGCDVSLAEDMININKVEFDEDNNPINLDDLVKNLMLKHQILNVKKKNNTFIDNKVSNQSAGNPDNSTRKTTQTLTKETINNMSPNEIRARWKEIQQFLSNSKGS